MAIYPPAHADARHARVDRLGCWALGVLSLVFPAAGRSCEAVALRLMPAPSIRNYEHCYREKLQPQSEHNWSTPGAEAAAVTDCWCRNNLTETIEEYGCCDHPDFSPMCTLDCNADCTSPLAVQCMGTCPAICFESDEFAVDQSACDQCDWTKCWPALQCILRLAETHVQQGLLEETCHEVDFEHGVQLANYWKCWRNMPKHTSQWNILSSMAHCICREDIKQLASDTSCCNSVIQGAGVCELDCRSEAECNTQEAQTCIHTCERKCPAYELISNEQCRVDCLGNFTGCHRFITCRPRSVVDYVCDDGRWPNGATGCCLNEGGQAPSCPRLCESQTSWRLDGPSAPWWLRWHHGGGIVQQCTCEGCPKSAEESNQKLQATVDASLWDNGQIILTDIARREGLTFGPNRRMQELMAERNEKINAVMLKHADGPNASEEAEMEIAEINDRYGRLITIAARMYPDDGGPRQKDDDDDDDDDRTILIVIVMVVCTVCIMAAMCFSVYLYVRHKKQKTLITEISGPQVVVGNPVNQSAMSAITADSEAVGAPVTVSAPVVGKSPSSKVVS